VLRSKDESMASVQQMTAIHAIATLLCAAGLDGEYVGVTGRRLDWLEW
jgi:hypothetical protein